MQAMAASGKGAAMPKRSPGKPAGLAGKPSSVPTNKGAKQPKGKGKPQLKMGNVKGLARKGVVNIKDMGI